MIDDNELRSLYLDYVENFDPTPQYLYDDPYQLLDFNDWYDYIYEPSLHETSN